MKYCITCQCRGWLVDSHDSGSGAQVYCSCKHGLALRLADLGASDTVDEYIERQRVRELVAAEMPC